MNQIRSNKLKKDNIFRKILFGLSMLIIGITIAIIVFLFFKGTATFFHNCNIFRFLFSKKYDPSKDPKYVGALVFIVGTLETSIFALLIAGPLAIACAIFIVDISPKYCEKYLRLATEILVGIPSTVYGLLGLTVVVPFCKTVFHLSGANAGLSLFSAIIVLSVMIFPYITFMTVDSLKMVNKDVLEASYGLGATRWQTIYHIHLPAAKRGIISGVVMGFSRAIGEALAVSMVIGKRIAIPQGLFDQTFTLTTAIASYMGDAVKDTPLYNSLWSMALVLLIISFVLIIIIRVINKRKVS